MKVVIKQS